MSEEKLYFLILKSVPALDSSELVALRGYFLTELGLELETAQHVLKELPSQLTSSSDFARINEFAKQLRNLSAEVEIKDSDAINDENACIPSHEFDVVDLMVVPIEDQALKTAQEKLLMGESNITDLDENAEDQDFQFDNSDEEEELNNTVEEGNISEDDLGIDEREHTQDVLSDSRNLKDSYGSDSYEIYSAIDDKISPKIVQKQKKTILLNVLLTILLSLVIFSVSYIFANKNDNEAIREDVKNRVDDVVRQFALDSESEVEDEYIEPKTYKAKFSIERITLLAEALARPGKIFEFKIYGENGAISDDALYLSKLEFISRNIRNNEDGSFETTGVVKLFIESDGQIYRPTAKAYINGHYGANNDLITARILISRGFDKAPKQSTFIIESDNPEEVKFFIDEEIVLTKKK